MNKLEIEELKNRFNAMALEEKRLVAQSLPDHILWEELYTRYNKSIAKISIIENTIKIGERK